MWSTHHAWGLLFGLVVALQAHAEVESFPIERFRPSLDRQGIIDVESAAIPEHLNFDAALWGNYALNPLVLERSGDRVSTLVAHRIGANVAAQLALFDWVSLGIDIPAVVFQARDTAALKNDVFAAKDLSVVAVSDIRLAPKIRILREKDQFLNLALMPGVTIPTATTLAGFGASGYAGEGNFTFVPELLASRTIGAFRLGLNVGARLRFEEERVLNLTVGHELTYRGGVAMRLHDLTQIPLELAVSTSGATYLLAPFQSGFEENPLELLAGATYDVMPFLQVFGGGGFGLISGFGTPDLRAYAGLRLSPRNDDKDGDGIANSDDACIDVPEDKDGFEDTDGCPDVDNDKDTVLDVNDKCINEPEDLDQFEDSDGCPDADNDKDTILDVDDACRDVPGVASARGCPDKDGDGVTDSDDRCPDLPGHKDFKGCPDKDHDGIPDIDDKCPDEPETINGIKDDDGCPDKGKTQVKLTKEKIEITEKVYFDFDSAVILPKSFKLLDQVSAVLRANPEITRVRVEGHTDNVGVPAYNEKLSQARSEAVRQYIVDKGIDRARLDARGFGEVRPVASNDDEPGRELNRRVEFHIVELDGKNVDDAQPPSVKTTTDAPSNEKAGAP